MQQPMASRIVERFKGMLSETARREIGDAQWQELEAMIDHGISSELASAAELVEETGRRIRARVDRPDLGL